MAKAFTIDESTLCNARKASPVAKSKLTVYQQVLTRGKSKLTVYQQQVVTRALEDAFAQLNGESPFFTTTTWASGEHQKLYEKQKAAFIKRYSVVVKKSK